MKTKARLVKRYDPGQVSVIDKASEVRPEDVGLNSGQINKIWRSVESFYRTGLQPAISICIRRQGQIVMNRAIGHTHGNEPGVASNPLIRSSLIQSTLTQATPKSLFSLYSASKAIAAVVVHHMEERGLVHLEDPLQRYMPEFNSESKRYITVRHVLLHQAGLPKIPKDALNLDLLHEPGAIRSIMAQAKMQWGAGRKTGYHAVTGGFIIGELVQAVTGMSIRDYLHQYFLEPMGFETFNFGVETNRVNDVAPNVYTGHRLPKIGEKVVERLLGVTYQEAIEMSNDPRFLTAIIPAANTIGTAEETSRFYEMLLHGGDYQGTRIMKPETINRAIAEQTHNTVDRMLGFPMRYSLGFMLGRKSLSLYGQNTAHAFGHLGMINIAGYADPQRDITVGILNNGKPGIGFGMVKFYNIMDTIAREIPRVS